MRIKFNEKANRPKLEYGKTYDIDLFACSFWWEFTFTRKNQLFIRELAVEKMVDGVPQHKVIRTFKTGKPSFLPLQKIFSDGFSKYKQSLSVKTLTREMFQ